MESSVTKIDVFRERLHRNLAALSPAAKRVAEFIDRNRGAALASSALELASHAQTSDATVVRVVQTLGFAGLSDLKAHLAASVDERSTPADKMRRTLNEVGSDAGRAIDSTLQAQRKGLESLNRPGVRERMLTAVSTLQKAERVVIFGVGPTAFIAKYVALLLARSGYRSSTLDATGSALADQLLDLRSGDALLILAYSPAYAEVLAVFAEAAKMTLDTVLVTDRDNGDFNHLADVTIPVQRGLANRAALHATTLACVESLVLGMSAINNTKATMALDRLDELRDLVKKRSLTRQ